MAINIDELTTGLAIRGLEERIANPAPFLAGVGGILVASSQKAFREQKFGGIPWPERYPNQKRPRLNIAGALSDAAAGRPAPKPNRFQERPAGMDTGALKNSISFRVEGDKVFVGSKLPYASIIHEGGTSVQIITDSMRKTVGEWLIKSQNSVKLEIAGRIKGKVNKKGEMIFSAIKKNFALRKLAFVLKKKKGGEWKTTEKDTEINARPFVGLTDESRGKVIRFGEDWFNGRLK